MISVFALKTKLVRTIRLLYIEELKTSKKAFQYDAHRPLLWSVGGGGMMSLPVWSNVPLWGGGGGGLFHPRVGVGSGV